MAQIADLVHLDKPTPLEPPKPKTQKPKNNFQCRLVKTDARATSTPSLPRTTRRPKRHKPKTSKRGPGCEGPRGRRPLGGTRWPGRCGGANPPLSRPRTVGGTRRLAECRVETRTLAAQPHHVLADQGRAGARRPACFPCLTTAQALHIRKTLSLRYLLTSITRTSSCAPSLPYLLTSTRQC